MIAQTDAIPEEIWPGRKPKSFTLTVKDRDKFVYRASRLFLYLPGTEPAFIYTTLDQPLIDALQGQNIRLDLVEPSRDFYVQGVDVALKELVKCTGVK